MTPSRRAAGRFIGKVRRSLRRALAEETDQNSLTQAELARKLGIHRSVVNREFNSSRDITLGRVAELAWAMNREIDFTLKKPSDSQGSNIAVTSTPVTSPTAQMRIAPVTLGAVSNGLSWNEAPTNSKITVRSS
ncbi:helix-turn-helix domain-containing protein [Asticcacaulis sp.]|uniref:helix-turn-helix domain-containing protein n=1 Tax=Asticcacaulis sp. TaxID=1872648 RepID=UPI003F7BD324